MMTSKIYLYVSRYNIIVHIRSFLSTTKARLEPTTLSALEKANKMWTLSVDPAGARSSFTRCHCRAAAVEVHCNEETSREIVTY
jgi:hypothetical protein